MMFPYGNTQSVVCLVAPGSGLTHQLLREGGELG